MTVTATVTVTVSVPEIHATHLLHSPTANLMYSNLPEPDETRVHQRSMSTLAPSVRREHMYRSHHGPELPQTQITVSGAVHSWILDLHVSVPVFRIQGTVCVQCKAVQSRATKTLDFRLILPIYCGSTELETSLTLGHCIIPFLCTLIGRLAYCFY